MRRICFIEIENWEKSQDCGWHFRDRKLVPPEFTSPRTAISKFLFRKREEEHVTTRVLSNATYRFKFSGSATRYVAWKALYLKISSYRVNCRYQLSITVTIRYVPKSLTFYLTAKSIRQSSKTLRLTMLNTKQNTLGIKNLFHKNQGFRET